MSHMSPETQSGWLRATLIVAAGVVSLAASTYTVVAKITEFDRGLITNTADISDLQVRTTKLENDRLPTGLELGRLSETLKSLEKVMVRIETRMERIETITENGAKKRGD